MLSLPAALTKLQRKRATTTTKYSWIQSWLNYSFNGLTVNFCCKLSTASFLIAIRDELVATRGGIITRGDLREKVGMHEIHTLGLKGTHFPFKCRQFGKQEHNLESNLHFDLCISTHCHRRLSCVCRSKAELHLSSQTAKESQCGVNLVTTLKGKNYLSQ